MVNIRENFLEASIQEVLLGNKLPFENTDPSPAQRGSLAQPLAHESFSQRALFLSDYPNIELSAHDAIKYLNEFTKIKAGEVPIRVLVCFERLGLIAIVQNANFTSARATEITKADLLANIKYLNDKKGTCDSQDSQIEILKAKLLRVDLYPNLGTYYSSFQDKRIALTRVAKDLLEFAKKFHLRDKNFIELWETYTIVSATPFQRAAMPKISHEIYSVHQDLQVAFQYTKSRWPGKHNLDKLYPELFTAACQLDVLSYNLLNHPQLYGYTYEAPRVVKESIEKMLAVIQKTIDEITPFIIAPYGIDKNLHLQSEESDRQVKNKVIATGV
ncbi:MAG: hypothetical protein KDD56_01575, partial [Bdellovibrionales bacterium]|nr:hypothetical protein [Bdellovibrionales bacterium]